MFVIEGVNDISFLKRISSTLHADDPSLPDLEEMERQGELIFIPFGGGHVRAWSHRLAPLGLNELHLYDQELPPETDYRRKTAESVNQRERCRAVLTGKRSLENYLHPQAILDAGEVHTVFDDSSNVPEVVAEQLYLRRQAALQEATTWEQLPAQLRGRRIHHTKKWLNSRAVERMTPALLRERDPDGEILSWLQTIQQMAEDD